MRRRVVSLVVLAAFAAPAALAAPATQPATRPTTQSTSPGAQLGTWFAELADPDADVRASALTKLLSISRADLDALRAVVEQAKPVAPAQAAALHDVIVHVYLSGDPFEADPNAGFLGVRPLREDAFEALQLGNDPAADVGVPVGERLPGFCGFQGLRGGDVILGVLGPRATRLARWMELRDYVSRSAPGETLTFEVLRQGRVMKVPIKLDPRPLAATDNINLTRMGDLLAERAARAEAYWAKVFKPLIEPDLL